MGTGASTGLLSVPSLASSGNVRFESSLHCLDLLLRTQAPSLLLEVLVEPLQTHGHSTCALDQVLLP